MINPNNYPRQINTAIVGFGLSGKVFHAPFVETNPGFNLHTIVSSGNEAQERYPNTRVVSDFKTVIDDPAIELIVICTPHYLHVEQAEAALEAGKHVVIEKPVALKSDDFVRLMEKAKKANRFIFPYHNRRWDGDFLTIKEIIHKNLIGQVVSFESRFDRYNPNITRAEWRYTREDGGGNLFDLGTHLIDQAVDLFGKPQSVFCLLYQQRKGSKVNDSFDLKLIYPKLTASLRASVFVKEIGPRFEVHGTLGSYVKHGLDRQEKSLQNGMLPDNKYFGLEPRMTYGTINTTVKTLNDESKYRYPSVPGNYWGFYEDVFAVINGEKEPEIKPEDALLNLRIIEAAFKSYEQRRIVDV